MKNSKKFKSTFVKNSLVLLTFVLVLLLSTNSFAGTDGQELQTAYDKLTGIVGGIGGKIVALFSGVMCLIGCAVKFNGAAILSFFGVAVGVGTVSYIVDSTVTCMLYF